METLSLTPSAIRARPTQTPTLILSFQRSKQTIWIQRRSRTTVRRLSLENTYPQQCGVSISFTYPVQLVIPFTSVNATTVDIPAHAQMRLEDQPVGGTCP